MDMGDREVNEVGAGEVETEVTMTNHQEDSSDEETMASIPPLTSAQRVDEVVFGQGNPFDLQPLEDYLSGYLRMMRNTQWMNIMTSHQEESSDEETMASIPPLMSTQRVDEVVDGQGNNTNDLQVLEEFLSLYPNLMRNLRWVVTRDRSVYLEWRVQPQITAHPRLVRSTHTALHLRRWEGVQQSSRTNEVRRARDGRHGRGQNDRIRVDMQIPDLGQGNVSRAA